MKKSILITGGTSGIGAALTQIYVTDNDVFFTGSKLAHAISAGHYICADQQEPLTAAHAILAALKTANVDHLDIVILNAGIGFWREPAHETVDEIRATLDVNLGSNITLAHQLFSLLEKAKGRLVLIGSSSYKGQANLATYAASKAALDGFARALRSEWQGRVSVQIIHPGPTATPMHGNAGLDTGKLSVLFASAQTSAKMIASAIRSNRFRTTLTFARRTMFAAMSWVH